jgi:hypothetical protein
MKTLLDLLRDRLGSVPRPLPAPVVRRIVQRESRLGIESARRLLLEGRVAWGVVAVRVETKREPSRAVLVYSPDPDFDPLLVRISEVARAVLKVDSGEDGREELRPLRAWLGGARLYHRKTDLPALLSRGQPMQAIAADVDRRELPRLGRVADILPILVHDAVEGAIVIPSSFWSSEFRATWLELSA